MSLVSAIAVGNHASDGEVTDLQNVAQSYLLGHIPSITDFDDYDSSGHLDSSLAFQNAYKSIGRNVLYVPAGTYRIDANGVAPGSGQSLVGAGLNATIFNYAGTGDAFLLDGCIGSSLSGFKLVTTSTASTLRGVHIKNTSALSERNFVRDCELIQNSGTGRATGQVGILLEDNSASVFAQFWNTVEGHFLLNWETCIGAQQTGAGADGVNQNYYRNNVGAAFITGISLGPRCGDNVIEGFFGTHSSGSTFSDTCVVIGDGSGNSANNICTGIVSDMGANGRAFFIRAGSTNNVVIANNESGQPDLDSGTNSFCLSSKNLSGLNQRFKVPNFTATATSSIAGTLLCSKIQDTQSRFVHDTDVTLSVNDFLIEYDTLTATRTATLPAPTVGLNLIFHDGSSNASGAIQILVTGNINGSAGATATAVSTSFGSSVWRVDPGGTTWFLVSKI